MEHKLANCGRCGLEPEVTHDDLGTAVDCPVHGGRFMVVFWNAAQFAARTERINAAAVAITAAGFGDTDYFVDVVFAAERLIKIQDERARVRWAEMQKGE